MRNQPLRGLGGKGLWAFLTVLAVPLQTVKSVTVAHAAQSIGPASFRLPSGGAHTTSGCL